MSFTTAFIEEIEKLARRKKKGASLPGTMARGAAYGALGSSVVSLPAAVRVAMSSAGKGFALRAGGATTLLTALLPTVAGAVGGAFAHRFIKKRKGPKKWKKPSSWDF